MKIHESAANHYDAIIIGGGMGGLTAAALLAKVGKKVLLLEKTPQVGGLVAPLVHGHFKIEVGARLLWGCNPDGRFGPGVIFRLLDRLGIQDQVEFFKVQPFANCIYPDQTFQIYSGRQDYVEGLRQAGFKGLEKLPELLELGEKLYREVINYGASGKPWTKIRVLTTMPGFLRYTRTLAKDVLPSYIPNQPARKAVGTLWPYAGLPPSQVSFYGWILMMTALIEEGAYYCRGGLHQLAEAVARAAVQNGGEIWPNSEVKKVLVKDRRVGGVVLADGRQLAAPVVIANIDPRLVFGEMMEPASRPARYLRRLRSLRADGSGMSTVIVTDLDVPALGYTYENLVFDSWDEDQLQRTPYTGKPGFISLLVPTVADPAQAPPGQHIISVFTGLAADSPAGKSDEQRYGAVAMKEVERLIPGVQERLVFTRDGSAPAGYVTKMHGSIYGWDATPWQVGIGRPDLKTPVGGLVLAGHWTRPLQGVMSVMMSGAEAARMVLDDGRAS